MFCWLGILYDMKKNSGLSFNIEIRLKPTQVQARVMRVRQLFMLAMPLPFIETVCELNLENSRFYSIWLYKENLESSEVHKIHHSQSLLTNIALKLIIANNWAVQMDHGLIQ